MPETTKNQRLRGARRPPRHMTYIWWTLQRMEMAMERRGTIPLRNSPSASVSGAALNPAKAKMVIPAREIILLRIAPKNSPSSKIRHRRTEKPTLTRGRRTKRLRTIIIRLPPKTRQASTTTSSSCQRILPNKSVLNAGSWPRQAASRKSGNSLELIRIC